MKIKDVIYVAFAVVISPFVLMAQVVIAIFGLVLLTIMIIESEIAERKRDKYSGV